MLQKLSNLRLPIGFDDKTITNCINKKVNGYKFVKLDKLSLDSRRKNDIHYVASVVVEGKPNSNMVEYIQPKTSVKQLVDCEVKLNMRPIIIGSGPAGMFAGLVLAHFGLKPLN